MNKTTIQDRPRRYLLVSVSWAFLAAGSQPDLLLAQAPITSSGLNTQVTLVGATQYNITGGTRAGTNLFHSFGQFNVPANNLANFLNETGLSTSNILGRVTDNVRSDIFGTIQTTGFGGANLFLMNPAGFLFGPNATLNVSGTVAFTTANYLRLADNKLFTALPSSHDALLSSAPVAAFGFLGPSSGTITVQGSQLSTADGSIALIGGNVTIESGLLPNDTVQRAHLSAPNGRIQLASAASAGEFDVATLQALPNINGDSFSSLGMASFESGSAIDVSGPHTVSIKGGEFTLSIKEAVLATTGDVLAAETVVLSRASAIIGSNAGADAGGDIEVGAATVQLDGASVRTITTGEGSGGRITVAADTVSLTNGAQVVSVTEGSGTGGVIAISASENVTMSGYDLDGTLPGIATNIFNPNTGTPLVASGVYTVNSGLTGDSNLGNGGQIAITAPMVMLDNGATIASLNSGDGTGGNISLSSRTITMGNGAGIISSAGQDLSTFSVQGSGKGGDIGVTASESLFVSGANLDLFTITAIQSQAANVGNGGALTISAPTVTLDSGGTIATGTSGSAPGGAISVTAPNHLSISGFVEEFALGSGITSTNGPAINIRAGTINIADRGHLSTTSDSDIRSGDLNLDATNIMVSSAWIGSRAGTGGTGKVDITAAETLTVSGQIPGEIDFGITNRSDITSLGPTAGIEIHADKIFLTNSGQILSATGSLIGATINVRADTAVTMELGALIRNRRGSLDFGSVNVSAPSITMNNASIESRTFGTHNAGVITVNATNGNLSMSNGSHILSSTEQSAGNAGSVVVTASESILLSGGSTITSNSLSSSTGNGGSVTATADISVALTGAGTGLFSTTNTSGSGGSITVKANQVEISNGAVVSAKSTGSGSAGSVTIKGTASPAQSLLITGPGSSVLTETSNTGAGGDITAWSYELDLANGATISSRTTGQMPNAGDAGDILIKADDITISGGASITAASTGTGNAGTVTIQGAHSPADSVLIEGVGSGLFSNASGTGKGGDILIIADDVELKNGGILSAETSGTTSTATGGTIAVKAEEVRIESGGTMTASSSGPGKAGNILIEGTASPAESIRIDGTGSGLFTETSGTGAGGDITTWSEQLRLTDHATISSRTTGQMAGAGDAGNILVKADAITISGGATITAASTGTGNAGTVTIQGAHSPAESLLIEGVGSGLFSNASGTGKGGDILVIAGDVELKNGGILSAKTTGTATTATGGTITVQGEDIRIESGATMTASSSGPGKAGNILLEGTASPAESIRIDGPGSGLLTETSGTGAGGDITTWSEQLRLTNGSTISAKTTGQMPNAGDGGNILIKADDITISGGATITAASTGTGNAGTVTIQGTESPARSLLITGAGSGVFSNTSGTGAGGDLVVISETVRLADGGTLSAATSGADASAIGGTIGILADNVRIENGVLTASSTGQGEGGAIGVLVAQKFESSGGTISTAAALADAGDIGLLAGESVTLNDGTSISTRSTGPGDAGSILIYAGQRFEMRDSAVTAEAANAAGGDIDIRALDRVKLVGSLISTSVLGGEGSGGNIFIDPNLTTLQASQILAQAVLGNGGNITLVTRLFFADPFSRIDASSQFGRSGSINIQSPTSDLAGTVSSLPSSMRQAQSLQTGRCAALANSQSSSFLIAGRDAIPTEPGGWQPSPFALVGDGTGLAGRGDGQERLMTFPLVAMAEDVVSLRRLTPAGFLTQSFAESGSTGCRA